MDLTKNQVLFLIEIAKYNGKTAMSKLGKKVWNTAVSIYGNMNLLRDGGYITISRRKNTIVAELTKKGQTAATAYFNVAKDL